jgi:plastocyanin
MVMNKKVSSTILIIILASAGYFFVKGLQADKSGTPSNIYKAPQAAPVVPVSVATTTITRTENGFSPSEIAIKKGETVTFVNSSTDPMWPASNPHPAHTGYPVGGGCRASAFDACKGIAPGASWSYTFDTLGAWGFHDHLSPQFTGTITVQ